MNDVAEIYNQIAGASAQEEVLSQLDLSGDTAASLREDTNNSSTVSRSRLIAWIVAYAMWTQQVLFRQFRADVQELALDGHYGTKRWYVATAKAFQLGQPLVFTDQDAYYENDVPAARIVSHAAVTEMAYKVIVKVAKSNGSGLVALHPAERLAVQDYFDELRPLVAVEVRSAQGDEVRIQAKVVCDAKLGMAGIGSNVNTAINTYLTALDFNGVISRTKLNQVILAVPGVIDAVIDELQVRINSSSPWSNVHRIATTFSGWARISSQFPLSTGLQFVSSNV